MRFDPDRIWWPGWRLATGTWALIAALNALPVTFTSTSALVSLGSALVMLGLAFCAAFSVALKSQAKLNEEDE